MKQLLFEIYIALRYTYPPEEAKSIFNDLLDALKPFRF